MRSRLRSLMARGVEVPIRWSAHRNPLSRHCCFQASTRVASMFLTSNHSSGTRTPGCFVRTSVGATPGRRRGLPRQARAGPIPPTRRCRRRRYDHGSNPAAYRTGAPAGAAARPPRLPDGPIARPPDGPPGGPSARPPDGPSVRPPDGPLDGLPGGPSVRPQAAIAVSRLPLVSPACS
jgi:hypothetical protein